MTDFVNKFSLDLFETLINDEEDVFFPALLDSLSDEAKGLLASLLAQYGAVFVQMYNHNPRILNAVDTMIDVDWDPDPLVERMTEKISEEYSEDDEEDDEVPPLVPKLVRVR